MAQNPQRAIILRTFRVQVNPKDRNSVEQRLGDVFLGWFSGMQISGNRIKSRLLSAAVVVGATG